MIRKSPPLIDVKDAAGNTSQLNFQVQYSDTITRAILRQEGATYFSPAEKTILTKPDFEVHMTAGSLYDTVKAYYFRNNSSETANAISALHQLNDASIPVHESFTVRIRPYKPIPDGLNEKVLLQRTYRNNKFVRKANWQGEWLTANFDDFGSFQAFIDTVPPSISDLNNEDTINLSASTRIVFTPTDNFGVVKNLFLQPKKMQLNILRSIFRLRHEWLEHPSLWRPSNAHGHGWSKRYVLSSKIQL